MKQIILILCTFTIILAAASVADDKLTPRGDLPMEFPNFRLPDLAGDVHELSDWSDAEAIVLFLQGNGCPIVRQSLPYLKEVRDEFESKGVKFVMINSNAIDDVASIQQELEEYDVEILTLKDTLQAVARAVESDRTAETFVIDPESHEIIYRGEADDRFGYGLQRSNPQEFYLVDALNGWLEDRSMPNTRIRVTKGCLMDLTDLPENVSFETDVKPVLNSLCATCDHDDPDKCISAWNEKQAEMHTELLWEMLLTQQKPAVACCEPGTPIDMAKPDAITLMSWLRDHQPAEHSDGGGYSA